MNKKLWWPLGIFLVLVVFLGVGLNLNPREVPSPLVGKPAPGFSTVSLVAPERVLRKVRNREGVVWPGIPSVHQQLVNEMGGAKAWCEMTADLDIAREDFKW